MPRAGLSKRADLMKINEKGLTLIKNFESLRLDAYLDAVNVPTIGYGSTGADIHLGMKITLEEANKRLLDYLAEVEPKIDALVKVELNSNEFSALCCFVYNVGIGALKGSTLLKKLNAGADKKEVAKEFGKWTKAGGKELKGLVRRRKAEAELFLSPA